MDEILSQALEEALGKIRYVYLVGNLVEGRHHVAHVVNMEDWAQQLPLTAMMST